MKQLPLHYFSAHIGFALVDSHGPELSPACAWRLDIPQAIRRRGYTNDVLVGLLREDPFSLSRCHPILTLSGFQQFNVRLSKLLLRPLLIPLLNEVLSLPRSAPRKESLSYELIHQLRAVGRVVFLDRNRVNCQLSNLVEVSVELPESDSTGLFHME